MVLMVTCQKIWQLAEVSSLSGTVSPSLPSKVPLSGTQVNADQSHECDYLKKCIFSKQMTAVIRR